MQTCTALAALALLMAVRHAATHPAANLAGLREPRATCGYDACAPVKEGMLNVHMVPHTHDDVGWLKTLDQYYYGGRTNIQRAGVQYILDSVVSELLKDPSKRFIYVETAFLWKWWQDQDEVTRGQVRQLIDAGQLEVISGAWSMNDEAVTHYQSTIDQFTWGFRVLEDTLGACARPHVGWQIDPFGHSREMASLSAQMGFDGVFFARLDYQDKIVRLADKTAEVLWNGSPDNLGASSDLFTHALYHHYSPPPGFCFDILCSDEPMVDDQRSPDYNIPNRVNQFVEFVKKQAESYRTNNVILTMGEDFHYQDAHVWYKNMDKIIKYVNAEQVNGGDVNVIYSTPSCYLKAVNDADQVWPTKQDDFFPYASDFQSFWTGYFTSKPTTKYFERLGNNFLQVSKQVAALSGASELDADVTYLREAMGVMQHHDAITGTMKDHVAQDYSRILAEALEQSGKAAQHAINLLVGNASPTPIPVESCLKLNISQCAQTESSEPFVLTVYNPLSRPVSQYVRVPVTGAAYSVQAPDGSALEVQIVPVHSRVLEIPGRTSQAVNDLVFSADNLPPLGFRSYYVTPAPEGEGGTTPPIPRGGTFGNERVTVTLDDFGLTESVNMNGVDVALHQTFEYYLGAHKDGERSSGAYIFRPNGTGTVGLPLTYSQIYQGPLVQELHQTFADGWVSQVVRVYKEDNHVEFEWLVGPIPDDNEVGKEVISLFRSDLANEATFYTDSNGRETLKRVRDFRPTWDIEITETVSSNYYPVVSRLAIRDQVKGHELAVLVDRAQGGGSIRDGQLELMVHRRLFHDDGFGVGEALNEQAYGQGLVARGKHYVVAGPLAGLSPSLAAQQRALAQSKLMAPWTFVSAAGGLSLQAWADAYNMEYSGLRGDGLPINVQILTLESWSDGSLLLRLEHILEKGEDPDLSTTVTVNLQEAFSEWTVTSASEMTLGGNRPIGELDRLRWNTAASTAHAVEPPRAVDMTAVTLDPMQIRTFVINVAARH